MTTVYLHGIVYLFFWWRIKYQTDCSLLKQNHKKLLFSKPLMSVTVCNFVSLVSVSCGRPGLSQLAALAKPPLPTQESALPAFVFKSFAVAKTLICST